MELQFSSDNNNNLLHGLRNKPPRKKKYARPTSGPTTISSSKSKGVVHHVKRHAQNNDELENLFSICKVQDCPSNKIWVRFDGTKFVHCDFNLVRSGFLELFEQCGKIQDFYISPTLNSHAFLFLEFETPETARNTTIFFNDNTAGHIQNQLKLNETIVMVLYSIQKVEIATNRGLMQAQSPDKRFKSEAPQGNLMTIYEISQMENYGMTTTGFSIPDLDPESDFPPSSSIRD